ncbi:hypothetical protein D3C79_459180 [compost metagenome]
MGFQHPVAPQLIALRHAAQARLEPLQAQVITFTAVFKLFQPRHRHWQCAKRLADLLLQVAQFGTLEPLVLLLNLADMIDLLLQYLGAHFTHLATPLLPRLLQVVVKALGFLPFGTVQAHNLFIRQFELELPPDDPAFTTHLDQLVERDQVFMLLAAHLNASMQQPYAVVRVLCQVLAQRCRFKFHMPTP